MAAAPWAPPAAGAGVHYLRQAAGQRGDSQSCFRPLSRSPGVGGVSLVVRQRPASLSGCGSQAAAAGGRKSRPRLQPSLVLSRAVRVRASASSRSSSKSSRGDFDSSQWRFSSRKEMVTVVPSSPSTAAGSGAGAAAVAVGRRSVEEYLQRQTHRVVHVAFPDSSRLRYMGDDWWEVRLLPVTFFSISATPVCRIRVWSRDGTLRIFSDDLTLNFHGLPREAAEAMALQLNLSGHLSSLSPPPTTASSTPPTASQQRQRQQQQLGGSVQLGLVVDERRLPLPLRLLPTAAVRAVGDGILDAILSAMHAALMRGLVKDYLQWAGEEAGAVPGGRQVAAAAGTPRGTAAAAVASRDSV